MKDATNTLAFANLRTRVLAGIVLVVVSATLAAGCGSTKVYSPDKTVEYKGSIYNISEVRQLSTRLEAVPASGGPIDLQGYDSKKFDALVKEQGPLAVRSVIAMDDRDLVYEQKTIQKGGDFSKMQKGLADAYKKLSSFMADARKTQLKL
jgi:hypothetical protein